MSVTDPLIGKQLGDYKIVDILGRGGMAHVYRGYDQKLQRYAAVKVIDANLLSKENEGEYRERFQREARAVAHLNHPNIVGIFQFGEVGPLYYMAMAFVEGRDLGQILKEYVAKNELLPPKQVVRIVHDIAGALDNAHAAGVIHRDIKPSNIMVTPDNRAILTDFGLALSVPEGTMGNTFGSAHYIAPEQAISSANAVPQSDLYSLGVVLYQMLTGKVPFDDPSAMSVALKHLSEPPIPPRQLNPKLSPAVEKVVLKALEKEPSKRFQSGDLMARVLEEAFAFDPDFADSTPSHPSNGTHPSRLFPLGTFRREPREPGSSPTIQFSDSLVAASRMQVENAQRLLAKPSRQRTTLITASVVIVVLLIVALGGWALTHNGGAAVTLTPTSVALAALTESPTAPAVLPTVLPTLAPTDPSAADSTAEPAVTSEAQTSEVQITSSSTSIAPLETETAEVVPLVSETVSPSATRRATAESTADLGTPDDNFPVHMIYDKDLFVLINQSTQTFSIRGWTFVQHASFGDITFYASQWSTPLLGAVAPDTCYLIWRNTLSNVETPDYCAEREAWFAAGTRSRFWISSQATTVFEVFGSSGSLLGTCIVSAGECDLHAEE
ncbi:MAG: protein kinase [Chloroflexi bacterium]|nr:protein kinase [Chloroflexota bacterium]